MDESGAGGGPWAATVLVLALLLCLVLAGVIGALSTYLRMRREGLVPDDLRWKPWGRLHSHPRSVYLTLSVSCMSALVLAAGAAARLGDGWLHSRGTLSWSGFWAGFLVIVLVGGIVVRSLALARPLEFTHATVWLARPLFVLLRPVTLVLEGLLAKLAPAVWAVDISPPFSGHELLEILEEENVQPLLREQERDFVRSIFDLRDTELREIMVPRIDMVGLDVDSTLDQAIQMASRERFTRMPVWEGSADKILGVLHTKDLLWAQGGGEKPTVRQLLRPVHFLPESKKIGEALHEFRDGRVHLAVVVDEYGGTAGLVTLEDILEEIVGEIQDEFDQEGDLVRLVDPQRAVIDPRIDLDDLNETLGLTLPTQDSDTLAGLLYSLAGKVPARGEQLEFGALRFTIDRVERQRIRQVTLLSDQPLRQPDGDAPRGQMEGAS